MIKLFIILLNFILVPATFSQDNYYIWHWHLNYGFDKSSLKTLQSIPIKGLFLHSGKFSRIDNSPSFEGIKKRGNFINDIKSLENYFEEIHLCYTFGNTSTNQFVRKYLNTQPKKAIDYITNRISDNFNFYKSLNKKIQGIQIDLEGSGINFDIYKQLILNIKKTIKPKYVSITPMSSWIKKTKFKKLVRECDFIVPMLYDYFRGKTPQQKLKVTDYHWLKSMVTKYATLDTKVIHGLPTYSYSILYDHKNKMRVPWAVYNPNSVTENKRFKLTNSTYGTSNNQNMRDRVISYQSIGDFSFKSQSFKKNSTMKYNFVSASALSQYIEAIRSMSSDKDTNIAFFRYGKPSEELVLTAKKLKQAVRSSFPATFKLSIKKLATDNGFYLVFKNLGSSTYFGKTGFKLKFTDSTLMDSNSDFDSYTNTELIEDYFQNSEILVTPKFLKNPHFSLQFILENGITINKEILMNKDHLILTK
ncbi:MAG: hypothetical protein KC646_02155 [Candidatus Cloacimonetes bacterium]|nr:hypothetical protein [Candidatus Cloacimonadota bacterium]